MVIDCFKKLPSNSPDRLTAQPSPTQVSHIIPYRTIPEESQLQLQIEKVSSFWEVIEWFSDISMEELNGQSINNLTNLLTLNNNAHKVFDDGDLWFDFIPASLYPCCAQFDEVTI